MGMRLRVLKTDRTDDNGWLDGKASNFVGRTGVVDQLHGDFPAIQLKFSEVNNGYDSSGVNYWYHEEDLTIPIKAKSKKEMFDPNNLVVGV